jgi:hypothetical protein
VATVDATKELPSSEGREAQRLQLGSEVREGSFGDGGSRRAGSRANVPNATF